jgi:hypothetical protein
LVYFVFGEEFCTNKKPSARNLLRRRLWNRGLSLGASGRGSKAATGLEVNKAFFTQNEQSIGKSSPRRQRLLLV